ncbi:MAG: glycosyltransferase family 4 protein [Chloroflexi bacterium]|nr:glycosyltransferase family 4 protein [Chloroflexota bacterium]
MRENKSSYNVLMIAPTSFFASYGCHVRILEEARVLVKMGHEVTIVTYHNGQDVEGLRIERTLPVPWRKGYEVGSSRHKVAFDLLLAAKCASFTRRRPDIIHAHLHEGVFAGYPMSLLWDVPLVFDFQGSMTSEMVDHHFLNPEGWLFKPWLRLEKTLNRLPHAILTSSLHAAQLLQDQFHVDTSLITPIPDCVNADVFSPTLRQSARVLKMQWGIPAERQVVAYLGLLAEYQGTGLLLEAAKQVVRARPKTHFLIMGYPGVERYRMQAHGLGLDDYVTFTGRVPYPEGAPRFLAMGDIAVAPKLSATEGSGKLLNYMSMAMPVVAFDTPVSREYMGEHGVYAPPGDVAAFAEALIALLDDPQRAASLGQQLRQRAVDRYSWDWAGGQITNIYQGLLS